MGDEVRNTVNKLKAEAMVVPDAQAASIAEMFGTSTERVQRVLVIVSSGIAQAIKFACLFFGVFAWPHKINSTSSSESSPSSSSGSSSGSGSSGERTSPEPEAKEKNVYQFPAVGKGYAENFDHGDTRTSLVQGSANQPNLSNFPLQLQTNSQRRANKSEALTDLLRLIREKGCLPAQKPLCKRWNQPKSVVSEWVSDFEAKGYINRRRDGNRMSIHSGGFDASALHAPGTA
jgi:uncharacterized membrane protein